MRRKSLLIGINYIGSQHELEGCLQDVENVQGFLSWVGYPTDQRSQVILTDEREGAYYPTGANILAAMDWLVSEPYTTCFLHYSGHGGQVADPDGDRPTGLDDTIVPVDFESNGQIDSGRLHKHLVSRLHPTSSLFVIMDCCHSGSVLELPFVYRSDDDGNVNMIDNLKEGMELVGEASHLIQGGFVLDQRTIGEAKHLFAGATSFFRGLRHMGEQQEEGLEEERFEEDWSREHKMVTMFSGCRDDQTSADASIGGSHVGAMSWAFLECMKQGAALNYMQVLQGTRAVLKQSRYTQIPQLSVGAADMPLDRPLHI
ncbi:putative metacaspase [Saccharata proteae CBS 121410]|uniref:Putative metacaspase n=1 Tax=Saccharata proteae CBS 121410 TaxID=1314787 RepID=A0A6A5YC05_9PEZI|nr:putative metacaspase [Saccharata proteae CBS 121410]